MPKISLKSIKRENARLVLEAIARQNYMSKLDISNETGLSLMTVGKLINALGAGGIITRSTNMSQKLGRRAEVFKIRYDWLIPVFDISANKFTFMVTDLKGNIINKIDYLCSDNPLYISNEFVGFLKKTLELLRHKYTYKKLLGIAVSICGVYDTENDRIISSTVPELSLLKLMQNISKIFKTDNVVIDSANRLSAYGLLRANEDYSDKTIACVTINDDVECTVWDKGTCLTGSNNLAGRLGDLKYNESTYHDFVKKSQNVDDIFLPTVELLKKIVIFYDPDIIYLCSEKFIFYPNIRDRIYYSLINEMTWPGEEQPELVSVNSNTLEKVSGIISRTVDNWLDKLIEE